jgi:hypothetical protein
MKQKGIETTGMNWRKKVMRLVKNITIAALITSLSVTAFVFGITEKNRFYDSEQMLEEQAESFFFQTQQTYLVAAHEDKINLYEIIITVDEKWDGFSIPIPLKVTVRNNNSEVIHLPRNACGGGRVLVIKDAKGITVPQINEKLDEKEPVIGDIDLRVKVREGGCAGGITIEPGEEASYTTLIGKEYKLRPLEEYNLTIKGIIHSEDFQTKFEVTSLPLKLVVKSDNK